MTQAVIDPQQISLSITIPTENHGDRVIDLSVGDVLFMVGANGSGKSSLLYKLLRDLRDNNIVLVSAYRLNNIEGNIDYGTGTYHRLEQDIKSYYYSNYDRRYTLDPNYQENENNFAIQQLIHNSFSNANKLQQKIKLGEHTSPSDAETEIDRLNFILKKSGFVIELFLDNENNLIAKNNAYHPPKEYPLAQLSDGERAAIIIASNILCAKPGSVIHLDEPERHLHRRLVSSLLSELIKYRKDCIFIVSTHEIALPTYVHHAKILLVRHCVYHEGEAARWDIDLIDQHDEKYIELEESLKVDLLGSRKTILFVEGTSVSLDTPLYQALFPTVSVISKGSCEMVEQSVKGLRHNQGTHWVNAFGIVDNDNKAEKEIVNLAKEYVFSLSVYSIESIYYHPKIIQWTLEHAKEFNNITDINKAYEKIQHLMHDELNKQKEHLCGRSVNMKVRSEIMASLPKQSDIQQKEIYKKEVNIPQLLEQEYQRFQDALDHQDYDTLMSHYPIREANLLNPIAKLCGFADRQRYEHNVILMIGKNQEAREFVLSLLGGASEAIHTVI